jgi:uncharacterized repeat protein (TIGR01451 family)
MKKRFLLLLLGVLFSCTQLLAQALQVDATNGSEYCNPMFNTPATITVTGGTPPYEISELGGTFIPLASNPLIGNPFPVTSNPTSYIVVARDANMNLASTFFSQSIPYSIQASPGISVNSCDNIVISGSQPAQPPSFMNTYVTGVMPTPTSTGPGGAIFNYIPNDQFFQVNMIDDYGCGLSMPALVANPFYLDIANATTNTSGTIGLNDGTLTLPATMTTGATTFNYTYELTRKYNPGPPIPPVLVGNNYEWDNLFMDSFLLTRIITPGNCTTTHDLFIYGPAYTINGIGRVDVDGNGCTSTDPTIPITVDIQAGTASVSLNTYGSSTYTFATVFTNNISASAGAQISPSYYTSSPTIANFTFASPPVPITQNFCLTPVGTHHDLKLDVFPTSIARPGFNATYRITIRNVGNQVDNGCFTFTYDNTKQSFVSATATPSSSTASSVSFCTANINPGQSFNYDVTLLNAIPPTLNSGDVVAVSANLTMNTNTDEDLTNNSDAVSQTVVNSYDPNNKICAQGDTITPSQVNDYLNYTINFENTGTAPAENITVVDYIDLADYDLSTLIPGTGSAPFTTVIIPPNEVRFVFTNIYLPQTPGSNTGFVTFSIKPLASLIDGDSVLNRAEIFFDYNPAIITDYAWTEIDTNLCATVNLNATTTINTSNACEGAPIEINTTVEGVLNPTAGFTYTWYDYSNGIWDLAGYNSPNLVDVAGQQGNYSIAIEVVNANGCKDTSYFQLNVFAPTSDTINASTCGTPYTWALNGLSYPASGFYTQSYTSVNGCDSNIVLNLEFTNYIKTCDTTLINISTGIDANGAPIAISDPEINWTFTAPVPTPPSLNPMYVSTSGGWATTPINNTNAQVISHAYVPPGGIGGAGAIPPGTIFNYYRGFDITTPGDLILDFEVVTASFNDIQLTSPSGTIYYLASPNTFSSGQLSGKIFNPAGPIAGEQGTWLLSIATEFGLFGNNILVTGNIGTVACDTTCCPVVLSMDTATAIKSNCVNEPISITAVVNGVINAPGYAYQWYYTPILAGFSWIAVPAANGGNTASFNTTESTTTLQFLECVITSPNGVCKDTFRTGYTVFAPTSDTTKATTCGTPYTWAVDGLSYSASGFFTKNFTNINGCDSNKVLDLEFVNNIVICDTTLINISTGIDANGDPIATNDPEINWVFNSSFQPLPITLGPLAKSAPFSLGQSWGATPIPITNAGHISHAYNPGGNPFDPFNPNVIPFNTTFTYYRTFNVTTSGNLLLDFEVAATNTLGNIILTDPLNNTYVLSSPNIFAASGQLSGKIFHVPALIPAQIGQWQLSIETIFGDINNGFLVTGNIGVATCDVIPCPTVCAQCLSDSVNLNTGIDNNYDLLANNASEINWKLSEINGNPVPPTASTVVTNLSYSNPYPTQAKFIEYLPGSGLVNDLIFERTFMVCQAGNFEINLLSLADNRDSIFIDGIYLARTLSANQGFLLANAATAYGVIQPLTIGTHRLTAKLFNQNSTVSGFYMHGSIKPAAINPGILQPDICLPLGPLAIGSIQLKASLDNGNALLKWTTKNEVDLKSMQIEKSNDGVNFTKVNEVLAQNNANNEYEVIDQLSASDCQGKVTYRIKAVANNGATTYSNKDAVQCELVDDISIYPNPMQNTFNLVSKNKIQSIELYNTTGQVLQAWEPSANQQYNLNEIAAGVYYIKVYTPNKVFMQKITKQ